MKVKKDQFLTVIQSVSPGLSTREILEQSSCYVFAGGHVNTFNGELSCRRPLTPLSKELATLTGAVKADKLIAQLEKWPDEEVDVTTTTDALVFTAGRKEFGLKMEATVHLPIDQIERPEEWKKLPEDFAEAIGVVEKCAGTNETQFALICVHLSPKWLEACDNFHLVRWPMRTGLKRSTLIRKSSAKHLNGLGVTEWAETEAWLHFRNPTTGVELSCLRYLEDYLDLSSFLKPEGEKITLPKGLSEACEKAAVLSSENPEADQVQITLTPGRLVVRGEGASGWFTERKKVVYDGAPMSFRASPAVLGDLVKRHTEGLVSPGRLLVNAERYIYVLNLYVPEPETAPEESNGEDRPRRKKTKAVAEDE